MKKLVVAVIILACIAASVLIIINRRGNSAGISGPGSYSTETSENEPALIYVRYAGTYLSLDGNGKVCENNSAPPSGIPEATGIAFNRLTYGKKAEPKDPGALEYVIKVALDLQKNEIKADTISYENRMITVSIDRLQVKLGKDDKTDEKINDLSDFIDRILGADGVVDMQNGNANNYGYTFRAN